MGKMIKALVVVVCLLPFMAGPALAGTDVEMLIKECTNVVQEMMTASDNGVPLDLVRKSAGVAIIPALYKGGLVVGGSYGKGVVLAHKNNAWSPPAFFQIGMGSVGFQIGLQKIQLIMVVIGQKTMDSFLKTKFKLGGDVAIAAGPVGARASAAAEINMKGGIYSYSRTKGLFAGVSLEGAGIDAMTKENKEYYGSTESTKEILAGMVTVPASGQRLIAELNKYHQ